MHSIHRNDNYRLSHAKGGNCFIALDRQQIIMVPVYAQTVGDTHYCSLGQLLKQVLEQQLFHSVVERRGSLIHKQE